MNTTTFFSLLTTFASRATAKIEIRKVSTVVLIAACISIFAAPLTGSAAPVIGNASFEAPVMGPGGYQYNPTGASWTFLSDSGVAYGGPWFTGSAPDGTQAAFIQSGGTAIGDISQTITGLNVGTSYAVQFYAAQRPSYTVNPVTVSLGGQVLGVFSPVSTSFALVTTTLAFTANSSSAVLDFHGASNANDWDTVIDLVSLVPQTPVGPAAAPESGSSIALLAAASGVLVIASRRRRSTSCI